MATWLVGQINWLFPVCARLRSPSRSWFQARSHNIALQAPSPASLEIKTVPHPTELPDPSVFEPMTEEYAPISTSGPHHFTPLSSSEALVSLVLKRDFRAAESLRKEMMTHHIPIPRDALYLRAALHAITHKRRGVSKLSLDAFETWLSFAPHRHEERQSFHEIRQRIFRSKDYLNLMLIYRFGLILASKGYVSGDAAMQVVSTLSRYARLSVVDRYLREVEDASRDYHLKNGVVPPSNFLAGMYSLAIRTVTLAGKHEAALDFISIAQSRGVPISDFTLDIIAKHVPDRQVAIDRIRAVYRSWTPQDTDTYPVSVECETISPGYSNDIAVLAARLRSLRAAMRTSSPPSPHALCSFIIPYQTLGRTRALTLLRTLAYRHSPKSAAAWVLTQMLCHRSRRQPIHVLFVFFQHFHLVGVPRKSLLSLIRGSHGQQVLKRRTKQRELPPCPPISRKFWPSVYHTALVWEAIVLLSPPTEKERLYTLLLSLVRKSRQQEQGWDSPDPHQGPEGKHVRLQLPPNTYDDAHFSPFVSWWARKDPVRAGGVLQDMVDLGIQPSMMQWSMVVRGYAQHDDPLVALRILDRLEEAERRKGDDNESSDGGTNVENKPPSDTLLGAHTNALRGFVIAGDMRHAREVERRLVEHLGYREGKRPATDASIALLRDLEDRLERLPQFPPPQDETVVMMLIQNPEEASFDRRVIGGARSKMVTGPSPYDLKHDLEDPFRLNVGARPPFPVKEPVVNFGTAQRASRTYKSYDEH